MFQGTGALAFNATFYLQNNPDVLTAISNGTFQGTALDHFIQFGQFEVERNPNQFFDTQYYLAQNPDVQAAILDPNNTSVTSAFQHFVMFGFAEGLVRRPSADFEDFNPNTYIAANPDLQAAFGNLTGQAQANALFQHFLQFGVNEDRPGSGVELPDVGTPGLNLNFSFDVDTLVGSVNDDNFRAFGGIEQINAKDVVDGGAGFDTVQVIGGSGTLAAATFTSIEAFEFIETSGITADVSKISSVEEVRFTDAGGVNNVTVASSAVQVIFDDVQTGSTQSIKYVEGTTGSIELTNGSDLSTVNFTNAATATATNTINTVNVVSSGSGSAGNFVGTLAAGAALATVNISGTQALQIGDLGNVTTVNGAAASGDLDLTFTATKDVAVTGGAGDDRFDFGTTLTKADTVNGGAGDNVVVVAGGNYSSAAAASAFSNLTNIQTVEFVGKGTTLDGATFTNASITNLLFNTEGTDIVNAAGSARTYEFGTDNTGDATFNLKAGATVLNVDLIGDGEGGASVDALGVNLAGGATAGSAPTINLTSTGEVTSGVNSVGTINAVAGSTVVIDGSVDLDIGGAVNRVVIDASGFEGDLTVEGSSLVNLTTVTPAAAAAAAVVDSDVITLGAGNDVVELTAASSGSFIASGATTVFAVDVINNFTAGEDGDVLSFTDELLVDNTYTALTGTLQTAIDALAGADATLQNALNIAVDNEGAGWTAFTFQGETFAVYQADELDATYDAATDTVVQLNGVTVADLTQDNFGPLGI